MGNNKPYRRIFKTAPIQKNILALEIVVIILVALLYASSLLDFSPDVLQQTGEHNESSTLFIYFDQSLRQDAQFPLWNFHMQTGIPHSGDPLSQFYNPLILLISWLLPAITAIKVSVLLSFILLGLGQLAFGYVVGFRPSVRLWGAILLMVSGGMAMLWRLGWFGLVIGFAWLPFSIAFTLLALDTRKRIPIILAAVSAAFLFLSGSMYWFYYYAGVAIFLFIAFLMATLIDARYQLASAVPLIRRGAMVLLIVVGLTAVYLFPFTETLSLMEKHHAPDVELRGSQPVKYALINYIADDFTFYQSDLLAKAPSGSWMYIGVFPVLLLLLTPFVLTKARLRIRLLIFLALFAFLLAWQASNHNVIGRLYDAIPYLFNFRFPGRLLIVATIPLLLAGGFVLEFLFSEFDRLEMSVQFFQNRAHQEYRRPQSTMQFSVLLTLALVVLMAYSVYNVYDTNKGFAFAPTEFNQESQAAMQWLASHDSSVYYTQIGPSAVYWDWLPAAFSHGMKVINFDDYGRKLQSLAHQQDPSTPIRALPKYIFLHKDSVPELPAQLVHSFENINLYEVENVLPYSFLVDSSLVSREVALTPELVTPADAELIGPNAISVSLQTQDTSLFVVALESYYPGWAAYVDGEPAELVQVGDYLGVKAHRGSHEYEFRFEPTNIKIGLVVTSLAILFTGWYAYDGLRDD